MRKATTGTLVLAAMFGMSVPAKAEEPYYFHKAGVDRDTYMEDVNVCVELAGGVRVKSQTPYVADSNPYGVFATAFFSGFFKSAERRKLRRRVERTCMADKGYKRRSLDKTVDREIRKLETEEQVDRLFALVSVDQPVGKELVE